MDEEATAYNYGVERAKSVREQVFQELNEQEISDRYLHYFWEGFKDELY